MVRLNQGQTNDTSVNFTDNNSLIHDQLDSFTVRTGWYSRGLRHTFILPYFQDEWKVRPDLGRSNRKPPNRAKVRIFIEHLEKTFVLCSQFNPRPT